MEMNEYCIRAGEFARMCQTTRDTLRYYEKQGILVPHKNPENGYHYYSYAQISSYYFISTFRSVDSSVADIKEYLLSNEEDKFDEFVDKQYGQLVKMRAELDQKINIIANTKVILKQIRANDVGHPCFYTFPQELRIKLTGIKSENATSSGAIADDIRRHLEECNRPGIQAFPMGASVKKEDFMDNCYRYENVFSFCNHEVISGEADNTASDQSEGDIITLPGREAIVAACRESDGDIRNTYEEMKKFLKDSKKRLCSDVYSLSIVNVIDASEKRKYLKFIFACVL